LHAHVQDALERAVDGGAGAPGDVALEVGEGVDVELVVRAEVIARLGDGEGNDARGG
jgi:hypothetical protein